MSPTDAAPNAVFRLSDGRPLPLHLKALRAVASKGGSLSRRALQRGAQQGLGERLPAMRVHYDDGRVFELPAGDAMYGPILLTGEWEPSESRAIASVLRRGDFAVDIGANHGWYTLLMAEAVGDAGRILAAEPCPPLWGALSHNLQLNDNPAQIEPRQLALGAERGEVTLNVFDGLPHGHTSSSTLGRDDFKQFVVPSDTLDAIVGAVSDRPPALIKIDVEGAERMVFQGAQQTLRESPMVLLEVNYETSSAFGYAPSDLLTDLAPIGDSTVFRVGPDGLLPERDARGAPHGTAWLVVPESKMDRVSRIS